MVSGSDKSVIDLWFDLKARMINDGLPAPSTAIRPPSLRDAAYAYTLSIVSPENPMPPMLVESFVNGLELGSMVALKKAWEAQNGAKS
jgi:hypothetical protein